MANQLWEKFTFRCQRPCRISGHIKSIIRNWFPAPYNSKLLNALWTILLGFLFWTIWKERNESIFKNQSTPLEINWKNLCQNIQETLALRQWNAKDFLTQAQEQSIWDNWKLRIPQVQNDHNKTTIINKQPSHWNPPPTNVIKLNFDGASKGNPGKAIHGGIFRDHKGQPLLVYFGSIGWDTNNSAKLEGLWQGMNLAHQHNFHPIIIEGDSQILIHMVTKIQMGTPAARVATS